MVAPISYIISRTGIELNADSRQQGLEQFVDDSDSGPTSDNSTSHNRSLDSSNSASDSETDSTDNTDRPGVIYARVSSNQQAEDGRSLDAQVDEMQRIADDHDIHLIQDAIRDEGETGTDFDRDGIKKVFNLAVNDKISFLLVDDISRFGRNAPETLYYIHQMRAECDVRLVTMAGMRNVSQVQDLIETTMRVLIAHMSSQYRSQSALRSRVRGFVEKQNWFSWYNQVPIGYIATEDNWITPDPEETDVVTEMFSRFIESESYTATAKAVNDEFGDVLDEGLTYRQVKRNLQRKVYIGKPTIRPSSEAEPQIVHDPHLVMIETSKFRTAQSIIEEIATENEQDCQSLTLEGAIDEFGLFPVERSSPIVKLVCSQCNGEFRLNGQRELHGGYTGHNLECTQCGLQRRFPYQSEFEEMKARREGIESHRE